MVVLVPRRRRRRRRSALVVLPVPGAAGADARGRGARAAHRVHVLAPTTSTASSTCRSACSRKGDKRGGRARDLRRAQRPADAHVRLLVLRRDLERHGNRAARTTASRARSLTIPAACPRLRLGHENFLTRLGDHLGLHDVEFEYDDFNRRFRVKCDDQKFAFSLLDGKMMQWLLGADAFDSVEVDGPWVLLAVPKLDPARWLDLGTLARAVPPPDPAGRVLDLPAPMIAYAVRSR